MMKVDEENKTQGDSGSKQNPTSKEAVPETRERGTNFQLSYFNKDLVSEASLRNKEILDELRVYSEDYQNVKSSNKEIEQQIRDLQAFTTEKTKFVDRSQVVYKFWQPHLSDQSFALRMINDSLRFIRLDNYVILHDHNFSMSCENSNLFTVPKRKVIISIFKSKLKTVEQLIEVKPADASAAEKEDEAREGRVMKRRETRKAFRDIVFSGALEYDGNNFDMKIKDDEFVTKIKPLINSSEDDYEGRMQIFSFFTKYTISDAQRKDLWRIRIGNTLRIDRNLFELLKIRLKNEGLKKQVAKLIVDDLNRTLPNYQSYPVGQQMYDSVQLLLSLWHIYRPDIGYVQGMSFIIVILYYYYEDYDCFVLFCNLIITKKLMRDCYLFNVDEVETSLI